FIPQIPHALITELSSPGDTVADIFCGSGTTLIEALLAGRNAVGVDANPLACLVSAAKTARAAGEVSDEIADLQSRIESLVPAMHGEVVDLFAASGSEIGSRIPDDVAISFWFEPLVVRELSIISASLARLSPSAQL